MTTSDKPPKRSLTDAEKDEVLRDIVPILRELRVALADYNLRTHEIERLGSVAANHEERLATVESQVLAGVHSSSWADPMIPVTVEESRPDFLSPPPPRPPMNTYESINALALETAKQTPLLKKTAETNAKIVESNEQVLAASKVASARWLGAFVAALALGLSQNCSLSHLLPHSAPPPESHASSPQTNPPPASHN